MRSNTKLTGALAALVIAAAIAAPAAGGRTIPNRPKLVATCDPSAVPPPPSAMAASAAKEYAKLRACYGRAHSTTVASAPVAREPSPPTGFDWPSAMIGAIAAGALSLVSAAAFGTRRRTGRHAASA
jgi:hypothetical protein